MRCGFHAGRVDWTRDISHRSKSKIHGSHMSGYVPLSSGWSLVPRTFPRMSCSLFFYRHCLPHYYVECVRKKRKRPQPTHGRLSTPVALDHRVHPTSDQTSELVIYAVSGPGKQPSWAASGSKPTTGAVDLSAGAAIRDDALSAAGAWCCQCCYRRAAAASTTTALAFLRLFTFPTGMVLLELRSY